MNGNLPGDILIALGIAHQIRYPLYYVKKLGLELSGEQWEKVNAQRSRVAKQFVSSELTGKYLDRRINDNTFINFADLILNNIDDAEKNIIKIRGSLAVIKDGQAVFTNLEKVSKLGFDPAVMASPFITTIVDALSLLVYFNIATHMLHLAV